MAKCLKEKSYENISRQVLKEMNSRKIIDDFCGSIITDMKELDSYKRLKEISIMHSLFDPLTDEELKEKKKMEIAEIGILTLTIDSSLSELTTKKLKNFSKDIILDIIKDVKDSDLTADTSEYNSRVNENLISKNGRSESDIRTSIVTDKTTDTIADLFESHSRSNGSLTSENMEIESGLRFSVKNKNNDRTTKTSESSSRSNESQIPEHRSIESNRKISEKCKNTSTTANASKSNSRNNKNVISKNHKRKSSLKSRVKRGLSEKCETFSKKFMEMNASFLNGDDSESDVSIGSMSSVHTSDLSSFDDVISYSSEDELGHKKKKRISIDEANTKYFRGQLYDIYEVVSRNRRKAS